MEQSRPRITDTTSEASKVWLDDTIHRERSQKFGYAKGESYFFYWVYFEGDAIPFPLGDSLHESIRN